jgi:hypothetical protein
MKAILEGTAAEFRYFFRTGAPDDFDSDQVCMFCGCTDENACPGGCSWVAPGVCSRCAGIIHEALKQDAPGKVKLQELSTSEKEAKNVQKCTKSTLSDVIIHYSIDNLLIPEFKHDRKLKSSYKTLFFTEMDDGSTVLSYCATKLYVKREKVLEIPYPIPRGYFGHPKSGTPSNRATAIRFYREYLAEQPKSEKKLKSEKPPGIEQKPVEVEQTPEIEQTAGEQFTPVIKYKDGDEAKPEDFHPPGDDGKKKASKLKQPLLSGKNGAVVLAPFAEAERFDYNNLSKANLGPIIVYENGDGRVALKYYGHGDIVFITKEQVGIFKKMDKDVFAEYIYNINASKQFIIRKYIEALKDDAIGALGMVKTDTRVPKD